MYVGSRMVHTFLSQTIWPVNGSCLGCDDMAQRISEMSAVHLRICVNKTVTLRTSIHIRHTRNFLIKILLYREYTCLLFY